MMTQVPMKLLLFDPRLPQMNKMDWRKMMGSVSEDVNSNLHSDFQRHCVNEKSCAAC